MQSSKSLYHFGPYRLDPGQRVLLRDGKPVSLTLKAFDTLITLVQRQGHVVEKDDLMKQVWPDACVEESNLTQNIFTLRKVLGETAEGLKYIETVPRRGYRFDPCGRDHDSASRRRFFKPNGYSHNPVSGCAPVRQR